MVIAEGLKEFFDRKFAEMDRKAALQEMERRRAEQEREREIAEWERAEQEKRAAELRAAQSAVRAEGELAAHLRWVEWNERRETAFLVGADFFEPPPTPPTLEPAAPASNETRPAGPE